MNKRKFLLAIGGFGASVTPLTSWAQDKWGQSKGFPTGWGPAGSQQKWQGYPEYHVGNFSGGIETMLAHQTIRASSEPFLLREAKRKVKVNFLMDASEFAGRFNRTGFLIVRDGEIWHEEYRFRRSREMRLDRKSTRLNSSHIPLSRMPSSA